MKDLGKRLNFFVASFIGILGISLVSEVFQEDDPQDKIDDALLFFIGLIGIYWYKKYGYKTNKTMVSVILTVAAILTKIMAIVVEHADSEAVGDDIGVISALIVMFVFVLWQVYSIRKSK